MTTQQYLSDEEAQKRRDQEWRHEHDAGGFHCAHCNTFVAINARMGTVHRNHCNICLWSKHVDDAKGDRRAACNGGMEPIGLTFKHEGQGRSGEIMLIHLCTACQKVSINRIARDDPEDTILQIFDTSLTLDQALRDTITAGGIYILGESDRPEVRVQLFGK